jgi:transposase
MSRTWRSREQLEHQVVTLHGQHVTRRGIARACGVSRNTVKKILIAHATKRDQGHTALPTPVKRAPRW